MLMQVRAVVASVVLGGALALVARERLRTHGALGRLALLGTFGIAALNGTYFQAIQHLPIAVAVFIQFTAAVPVFLWGLLRGHEPPGAGTVAALALSIAGTWLMVGATDGAALPATGLAWAFAAMAAYAFHVVISHGLTRRLSPWTVATYANAFAALTWIAIQSPLATFAHLRALGLIGPALVFAGLSTLLPLPLFLAGLRRVTATGGAIASTSETVVASLIAWLTLGERLAPGQMAGGALILAAVLLLVVRRDRPPL